MCIHRHTWSRQQSTAGCSWQFPRATWAQLRAIFGPFTASETWLRACYFAALTERDGAVAFEVACLPGLTARDCNAMPGVMIGGTRESAPHPTSRAAAKGSTAALAAWAGGTLRSETGAKGPISPIRARMGGSEPRTHSPRARSQRIRRATLMRSPRSIARRLEERACLLAAIWVARIGRIMVREGLLNRTGAFFAFRLSSRLSRRAWAIWRSERALRRSALWGEPD